MSGDFTYDVFLSHSSKDKKIVLELAERLRNDGVKVWLDTWEIKPGDSIPSKIEKGLEQSRVLVLCMSANAFGSDWAQLESGTFRFRDPLNKERRFLPIRLDEAPIKGTLAQFLYINWLSKAREQEYTKLLESCRPTTKINDSSAQNLGDHPFFSSTISGNSHAQLPFSPEDAESVSKSQKNVGLSKLEINKLLNRYIGVSGGYLGDFNSHRSLQDFYLDLDLDLYPLDYEGTNRERFEKIISVSNPDVQARILEGILGRFALGTSEIRTQERRDEIQRLILRLRG